MTKGGSGREGDGGTRPPLVIGGRIEDRGEGDRISNKVRYVCKSARTKWSSLVMGPLPLDLNGKSTQQAWPMGICLYYSLR